MIKATFASGYKIVNKLIPKLTVPVETDLEVSTVTFCIVTLKGL
jgi:hypothetical protein